MLAGSSSVDKGSTSGQCGVCLLTAVAPLGWREHKESWLRSVRMSVNNGGATGYLQQSGLLIKVMVQRGGKKTTWQSKGKHKTSGAPTGTQPKGQGEGTV